MFPREKARWVILRPWGKVVAKPFDVPHQVDDFHFLIHLFRSLNGQASIVMECMGHYYKPVVKDLTHAGFFVSAVNPQIICNFQKQE